MPYIAVNKRDLAKKIQALEGLSNEERSALLGLLREHKKYGLVWEVKPEDVVRRLETELPILREVADRAIISDNPDAPNHILIEGDNLEALTTLAYTHAGKIDVIYIDPPYNTGNKDFVYNDSFVDSEDAYRHSKWLSFMRKRLIIAKKLLKDTGVIFISIDDNEQANLKVLCDDREIFGEQNFVAQFIWEQGRKSMAAQVAINHEYCLVYCKNRSTRLNFDSQTPNINWSKKKDGLEDIYAEYERLKTEYSDCSTIEKGIRAFYKALPKDSPSKAHSHYKYVDNRGLYFAGDISQGTGNGGRFDIIHPVTGKPCKVPNGGWRFGINKLPTLLEENRIHFGPDETTIPCLKRYLNETEHEVISSVFYRDGRGATKRLETLLGKKSFDHPKDEEIIKMFLTLSTSYKYIKDYTILDFFAGSGTTLHATMQLNAEDGGRRTCILCTNNENGICEDVTYERNKRVIEGYTTPKGEQVKGLTDNSLRYYRTEFVGRERTQRNMHTLVNLATDMLRIKEDLYTELPTMGGVKTHPQIFRFFDDGRKQMLIIYREEYIEEIVGIIEKMEVRGRMKVYTFSPSDEASPELFEPVEDKVEPTALPAAIYNAYKRILPKRKPEILAALEAVETTDENDELGGLFAKGGDE